MRRKRKWDASCLANSFNAPRFIFAARAMRLFRLFSMWKMFRKMFSQLLRLLPHTVCRPKYSSSPRHIVAAAPLTGEHVFNVNVISLCQRKDLESFEPKTNSLINIIFFVSRDTVIPFLYGHWIGVARVCNSVEFYSNHPLPWCCFVLYDPQWAALRGQVSAWLCGSQVQLCTQTVNLQGHFLVLCAVGILFASITKEAA